jgi:hypothetical protein
MRGPPTFEELFADAEHGTRNNEEERLHRSIVQQLRLLLPADCDMKHTPNGGLRHSAVAKKLVGLGVRAGHPDLDFVYRGRAFCIELKAKDGALSGVQVRRRKTLEMCGCQVFVCRTPEEVETVLRSMGVPLRGSLLPLNMTNEEGRASVTSARPSHRDHTT